MTTAMFHTLLIANRGEIACRIIRTARRLGIRTIAVYSEADANARHVREADEAWNIGPAPAMHSYLNIDAILAAAHCSGAEAIHPGYGFLSENAAFAKACADAGLIFVGPPAQAMSVMGDKAAAKALMMEQNIPLVPGYHGEDQRDTRLQTEADAIGYPLLIKPSAGGGGKGMHVVERREDFAKQLAAARREAAAAFGDERMLLEKYLTRARHVEMQIFTDTHGNGVYLFERDCSVQRRHQKILEEAPAPGFFASQRQQMGAIALAAAHAVSYVGAGTVEFILNADGGAFYFMEMNTRLQVEHPVTEMVTGLDLVEWQLRVAAGEPLPLTQSQLALHGHAVEVRVYAEDPERGFLPSSGQLVYLREPRPQPGLRIDSGVDEGDSVPPHYDPMIAKVIVHADKRETALSQLATALADFAVAGVTTNLGFLARLATHPDLAKGHVDTGFIARNETALLAPAGAPPPETLALLGLAEYLLRISSGNQVWSRLHGWRHHGGASHALYFADATQTRHEVIVHQRSTNLEVETGGYCFKASAQLKDDQLHASLDGHAFRARLARHQQRRWLFCNGASYALTLAQGWASDSLSTTGETHIAAPMPGRVVSLLIQAGKTVAAGTPLLILEAMKMEHTISAPTHGLVRDFRYEEGDTVEEGAVLLDFEPEL